MLTVPDDFIRRYWQKEHLLLREGLRAALSGVEGLVSRDQLFRIACDPQADARLVMASRNNWHCEEGPFTRKQLKALPAKNWTLLVQAVDQWLPEVAALRECFAFLPRWRLDDVMISCATKGGGVGPHFDYYDVFLVQASGTRRWRLGQYCDDHTPLRDHPDLKLLKSFRQTADYTLTAGDILYVPPGLAHWGTALDDDCITISIGFRAPSARELLQMAMDDIARSMPEHVRYRDTPATIDTDSCRINDAAIKEACAFWQSIDPEMIRQAMARALGVYATEKRNPDHPESRAAWRLIEGDRAELYVDGEVSVTNTARAAAICKRRSKRP